MLVTEKWLREQFDRFNKELFDGKLPNVRFIITRTKTKWGQAGGYWDYRPDDYTGEVHFCVKPNTLFIKISNFFDSPERVKQQVLIHEMIHIADYYFHPEHFVSDNGIKKSYDSHGEVFFMKEARRIKSISGFDISPRVTEEEQNSSDLSDNQKRLFYKKYPQGVPIVIHKHKNKDIYNISRYVYSNFDFWKDLNDSGYFKNQYDGYIYGMSHSTLIESIPRTMGKNRYTYQEHNGDLSTLLKKFKVDVQKASGSMENSHATSTMAADKVAPSNTAEALPKQKNNNPFIKVIGFYAKRIANTIFNLIKVKVDRGDKKALRSPMSFNINTELGPLKVIVNGRNETILIKDTFYVKVDISGLVSVSSILKTINDYLSLNESRKITLKESQLKRLIEATVNRVIERYHKASIM